MQYYYSPLIAKQQTLDFKQEYYLGLIFITSHIHIYHINSYIFYSATKQQSWAYILLVFSDLNYYKVALYILKSLYTNIYSPKVAIAYTTTNKRPNQ